MRLDTQNGTSASALVMRMPEHELANLIFRYGEEPASRKIARRIVRARERWDGVTAKNLANIVREIYPPKRRFSFPHPATRVFQALRIFVNKELERLKGTLFLATQRLALGGRIIVISFHSLEDRIVKHFFRDHATLTGIDKPSVVLKTLTKRVVRASEAERSANPASRSALLRIAERIQ